MFMRLLACSTCGSVDITLKLSSFEDNNTYKLAYCKCTSCGITGKPIPYQPCTPYGVSFSESKAKEEAIREWNVYQASVRKPTKQIKISKCIIKI